MPYIYAAFLTASETGAPVQRPLVFDHQDDPMVRDLDDEYLLRAGPARRPRDWRPDRPRGRCTCPRGDWYDWHSGRVNGRPSSRSPHADGADPGLRPRGRGRPALARGAGLDRRLPPDVIELYLFVPTVDGVHRSLLQEDDGLTFAADRGRRYRSELTVDPVRRPAGAPCGRRRRGLSRVRPGGLPARRPRGAPGFRAPRRCGRAGRRRGVRAAQRRSRHGGRDRPLTPHRGPSPGTRGVPGGPSGRPA